MKEELNLRKKKNEKHNFKSVKPLERVRHCPRSNHKRIFYFNKYKIRIKNYLFLTFLLFLNNKIIFQFPGRC